MKNPEIVSPTGQDEQVVEGVLITAELEVQAVAGCEPADVRLGGPLEQAAEVARLEGVGAVVVGVGGLHLLIT